MGLLFGPFSPTTGQLIEVDIPQLAAMAEVQNRSPYDLWASFSPQAPVTGRSIATGFYGQLVRASSSKRLTIPKADPNTSNLGKLWLYPFNPYNPTGQGTAGASTIYVVSADDPDELMADSGIASNNVGYVPTAGAQAFVPLGATGYQTDSQGNPFAYLCPAANAEPAAIYNSGTWSTGTASGSGILSVPAPGAGVTMYLSDLIISYTPTSAAQMVRILVSGFVGGITLQMDNYIAPAVATPLPIHPTVAFRLAQNTALTITASFFNPSTFASQTAAGAGAVWVGTFQRTPF